MQKLIGACLLLVLLVALQAKAFSMTLTCKFKQAKVEGVQTIQLTEQTLFINEDLEIPLEKSAIRCGHFGRQTRFDGNAKGLQVVLESCSTEAQLEGHLIDEVNSKAAELICDQEF